MTPRRAILTPTRGPRLVPGALIISALLTGCAGEPRLDCLELPHAADCPAPDAAPPPSTPRRLVDRQIAWAGPAPAPALHLTTGRLTHPRGWTLTTTLHVLAPGADR